MRQKGFATLLAILVVGAVATAITTSVVLLGVGSSKTSFAIEQSTQARALAVSCAEAALEQIRIETGFSGTGNLSLGQGSCTYTVTTGAGENRTVVSSGTVGTIIRKISIGITQINPTITISSWQEVADF